jgi:hypothetical protein
MNGIIAKWVTLIFLILWEIYMKEKETRFLNVDSKNLVSVIVNRIIPFNKWKRT